MQQAPQETHVSAVTTSGICGALAMFTFLFRGVELESSIDGFVRRAKALPGEGQGSCWLFQALRRSDHIP
jgi:hypothetical protein